MPPTISIAGLALTLMASGCGPASGTGNAATPDQTAGDNVEALRTSLLASVQLSCTATAQCRTRPVGAKPCGGPRAHLVYSIAGTDTVALARAAARYYAADSTRNARLGLVSDCAAVMAPPVVCASGACREERP